MEKQTSPRNLQIGQNPLSLRALRFSGLRPGRVWGVSLQQYTKDFSDSFPQCPLALSIATQVKPRPSDWRHVPVFSQPIRIRARALRGKSRTTELGRGPGPNQTRSEQTRPGGAGYPRPPNVGSTRRAAGGPNSAGLVKSKQFVRVAPGRVAWKSQARKS